MSESKYTLEPYKGKATRYRCPECQKPDKSFTRYIDTETGNHLADHVGRCNHESNCGYHYKPKQYFTDNHISFEAKPMVYRKKVEAPKPKPVSVINPEIFKAGLRDYESNHFIKYLISLFGTEITKKLISKYYIGTSKHWQGATVFWQIDVRGKIRTGKIMLYNPETGKRIKEPYDHINWVHTALKMPEYNLKQCFFGSHLLSDTTKPVAIVESEKTAIIASVYLPQYVWLAASGKDGISPEKCQILKGRRVTLFPDLKQFEKWAIKAKELNFSVSNWLETKATESERQSGLDIADYLVRYDYKQFLEPEPAPIAPEPLEQPPAPPANQYAIDRPYFLANMIANIFLNYNRSIIPNKTSIPAKEKYLQCYWQDCQKMATDYKITYEDLKQPFLNN